MKLRFPLCGETGVLPETGWIILDQPHLWTDGHNSCCRYVQESTAGLLEYIYIGKYLQIKIAILAIKIQKNKYLVKI